MAPVNVLDATSGPKKGVRPPKPARKLGFRAVSQPGPEEVRPSAAPVAPQAQNADAQDDMMEDSTEPVQTAKKPDHEIDDAVDAEGLDDQLDEEMSDKFSEFSSDVEPDSVGIEEEDDEEKDDADGGVPLSPSEVPVTTASVASLSQDTEMVHSTDESTLLHPNPPNPYTYDAGHLLVSDSNPLPSTPGQRPSETQLHSTARSATQSLLNHLLTTCPITRKDTSSGSGVLMTLPPPTTQLPREKHVPVPKAKTKWEKFAERKGITKKKKEGNLVFDEETGEWRKRYGFGAKGRGPATMEDAEGKRKKVQDDWLVEVDSKAERAEANGEAEPRSLKREERKEMMKRQARRERKNEVARRGKG